MNTRTRSIRRSVLAATLVGACMVFTGLPASAGAISQMSAAPTTLHAGESIAVSGLCRYDMVDVDLHVDWYGPSGIPDGKVIASDAFVVDDAVDGDNWSGSITVPEGTEPGAYTLSGLCAADDASYSYQNIEITVIADDVSTTVTSAPTTVAPTTAPAVTPAAPVAAQPTYTG
jgi:hypothetical protein